MVDAEAIRQLARERGTSESGAVRDAVAFALAAQDMVAALEGLHAVGAFSDFEELFGPGAYASGRVAEQRGISLPTGES
jgi:hypothetical protein